MTPVKSDSIAAVKHDPVSRTLTVEFKNGGRYTYADVSAHQHATLMGAESVGMHFQKHIRPHFKSEKVKR